MVKGFKKVLSLAFALLFAFGAMPMIAGVVAFAEGTEIDFQSINVNPIEVTLEVGKTQQLSASGAYIDKAGVAQGVALTEGVAWASADPSIVSVSNTGLITAVSLPADAGDQKVVVVSAFYTNKGNGSVLSNKCTVTVKKASVTASSIKWDLKDENGKELTTLIEGNTYSFKDMYKILPSTTANKAVEVTCEPENALEIDNEEQSFVVNEKIDDGIVRLTVTTKDGSNLSNTITLQVYNKADLTVKSVRWTWAGRETTGVCKLDYYKNITTKEVANYYYESVVDGEVVKKYKLSPDYAIEANAVKIEMISSDVRVADFDEETKRLVPKGNGQTAITIIVTDNETKRELARDMMYIVVTGAPYTPATGVQMTSQDADGAYTYVKEIKNLYYTETVNFGFNLLSDKKFTSDIDPKLYDSKGELLPYCDVNWRSSNPSVLEIDPNTGYAVCKDSGTVTVTLVITDNGKEYDATCVVSCKIRWWQWLLRLILGWIANIF